MGRGSLAPRRREFLHGGRHEGMHARGVDRLGGEGHDVAFREQMNRAMNGVPRVVGLAKVDHCGHRWHFREGVEQSSPAHRRRCSPRPPSRCGPSLETNLSIGIQFAERYTRIDSPRARHGRMERTIDPTGGQHRPAETGEQTMTSPRAAQAARGVGGPRGMSMPGAKPPGNNLIWHYHSRSISSLQAVGYWQHEWDVWPTHDATGTNRPQANGPARRSDRRRSAWSARPWAWNRVGLSQLTITAKDDEERRQVSFFPDS